MAVNFDGLIDIIFVFTRYNACCEIFHRPCLLFRETGKVDKNVLKNPSISDWKLKEAHFFA
jgi:hypothetical protein